MKKLENCNHCVKLYENFEDQKNHYLVLELCDDSDLAKKVMDNGKLTEEVAKDYLYQLMLAF